MCGRVQLDLEIGAPAMRRLTELLQRDFPQAAISSGDKYPADLLPVLVSGEDKPRLAVMNWGFLLPGSKKLIINARSETAAEKPLFRQALALRRCVLPTSGFYEWSHSGPKTKYLFRLAKEDLVYLGGLYQQDQAGSRFVILTQAANASMSAIHHRMPLVVRERAISPWLTDGEFARALLRAEGPGLVGIEQATEGGNS